MALYNKEKRGQASFPPTGKMPVPFVLPKRIVSTGVLIFAFCFRSHLCRADDVQTAVHALIGPPLIATDGERWEARKKALAPYTLDQLVRALINEIDTDRGSRLRNHFRDKQANHVFRALKLPPKLLCEELEKPQAPERKASLICVLRFCKSPQVTQALLRQTTDERSTGEQRIPHKTGIDLDPLRVRDVAYNALIEIIGGPDHVSISGYETKDERNRLIQESCARLKLTPP